MPLDTLSSNPTKAHDFKTCYANVMSLQFSPTDVIIRFGITPTDPNLGIEEQVAVAMHLHTAKALLFSLQKIIGHFETTTNTVIPVLPATEAAMDKAIAEAAERLAKK